MVLHGAWLVSISGCPLYTACEHCSTNIDPDTNMCKKQSAGCLSEPCDEVTVLATATLADFTGQLEKVLVLVSRTRQQWCTRSKRTALIGSAFAARMAFNSLQPRA